MRTIFDARRHLMEETPKWKTSLDSRQPLMEHILQCKRKLDGGQTLFKVTFKGKRLPTKESLMKTPFEETPDDH